MIEELLDRFRAEHHAPDMNKLPTMTPEELRAIREELGLQQNEAPPLFGVALNTYKRWERGERSIPGPVVILAKKYIEEHRKLQK